MPTWDEAMINRRNTLKGRGIDPAGQDDTIFGVDYVYCHAHLRAHSTGWCTVMVQDKTPLQAKRQTPDHGEGTQAATAEARSLGLYIYGDPRPCIHCSAPVTERGGSYFDAEDNVLCHPDQKRSTYHTPIHRF